MQFQGTKLAERIYTVLVFYLTWNLPEYHIIDLEIHVVKSEWIMELFFMSTTWIPKFEKENFSSHRTNKGKVWFWEIKWKKLEVPWGTKNVLLNLTQTPLFPFQLTESCPAQKKAVQRRTAEKLEAGDADFEEFL